MSLIALTLSGAKKKKTKAAGSISTTTSNNANSSNTMGVSSGARGVTSTSSGIDDDVLDSSKSVAVNHIELSVTTTSALNAD